MNRIAYFDLANGIAGDMVLGALVGAGRTLGVPVDERIATAASSLRLDAHVSFVDDERGGLACVRAEVKTDGRRHTAGTLRDAIERADASERAVANALRGLDALLDAEARIHGVDRADVHLHELGSADTPVDLLGAAVGLAALDVEAVSSAPVPIPRGWTRSGHGLLPVPAPVTLEVLRGATIAGVDDDDEIVTPSGAAILVGHDAAFGRPPNMVLDSIGIGGGSRITDRPNITRVLVGHRDRPSGMRIETCVLFETNIDDQSPEGVGHAVETLIADGALDAWVVPIVMKKSRPAFQLSVLARPSDEGRIAESLFRLTTTLGVRRSTTTRWALDRELLIVEVDGRAVRVKVARSGEAVVNVAPEFADCASVASATGRAPKDVYAAAAALARQALRLD